MCVGVLSLVNIWSEILILIIFNMHLRVVRNTVRVNKSGRMAPNLLGSGRIM